MSDKGHAFIDRALYLPKAWTGDPARCQAAHVPAEHAFATKPGLATTRRLGALACETGRGASAGAADSVYGLGELEMMLRRAGKGYVLGVHANHGFNSWSTDIAVAGQARDIAATLPTDAWMRLSAGHGTKGERLYDWTYCALADLDAADHGATTSGLWTRGLLIRHPLGEGDLATFTTWCPKGTPIETLIRVEGTRWRIEEGFETAKNVFGLDHNGTRSWRSLQEAPRGEAVWSCRRRYGWRRHVSLVMLAYAVMAAVRHQANILTPKKTSGEPWRRNALSAGRSRKSAALS